MLYGAFALRAYQRPSSHNILKAEIFPSRHRLRPCRLPRIVRVGLGFILKNNLLKFIQYFQLNGPCDQNIRRFGVVAIEQNPEFVIAFRAFSTTCLHLP